ncbi:Uncharacterised protein [Mycobacteroides abscessus subsp. massiliense]|nr:Uncharacterised protein [Mycobacteroides abscessus subsp. massiliense]
MVRGDDRGMALCRADLQDRDEFAVFPTGARPAVLAARGVGNAARASIGAARQVLESGNCPMPDGLATPATQDESQ